MNYLENVQVFEKKIATHANKFDFFWSALSKDLIKNIKSDLIIKWSQSRNYGIIISAKKNLQEFYFSGMSTILPVWSG